jgi:prepilin-type N-terminal cleavage/methylation domain-containing protein
MMPDSARPAHRAFSLIEVVVAIGIFAVGMVAVVALFAPVARSVAGSSDAQAAATVAERLRDELSRRATVAGSFAPVVALFKNSTANGGHEVTTADNASSAATDPRRDTRLLFASRDGSKIGGYIDSVWIDPVTGQINDAEKYFEITLIRLDALSPNTVAADAAASTISYTARIRWPAFVLDNASANARRALPAGFNATAAVVFDRSQLQTFHVAGSITR